MLGCSYFRTFFIVTVIKAWTSGASHLAFKRVIAELPAARRSRSAESQIRQHKVLAFADDMVLLTLAKSPVP